MLQAPYGLRAVVNSPVHLTDESNATLRNKHTIEHPVDQMERCVQKKTEAQSANHQT